MNKSQAVPARHLWRPLCLISMLLLAGCPDGPFGQSASTTDPATEQENPNEDGSGQTDLTPLNGELAINVAGQGDVIQEQVGATVTLTAIPADGWRFDGWTNINAKTNPVTILVTTAASSVIGAIFVESDDDSDGVVNSIDACPLTLEGEEVDEAGCAPSQRDSDGDSVTDDLDICPDTPGSDVADAQGCGLSQKDTDGDEVNDADDECPGTPIAAEVDEVGCAEAQLDDDDDGVSNAADLCPESPAGASVNAEGCAASEIDSDGDGVSDADDECPATFGENEDGCPPPAVCGNNILEEGEECEFENGDICDSNCQLIGNATLCGNNIIESPEQCDPPVSGLCDADCTLIISSGPAPDGDDCDDALTLVDGSSSFTTNGATTDGPNESGNCLANITADIWLCYTATCTGTATVSLCGASYDSTLAIYNGCGCPSGNPVGCNDDGDACPDLGSQVSFATTTGSSYTVRIGGFEGDQGSGNVTVTCNDGASGPICGNGITEPPEECDPPDGFFCDSDCTFIGGGDFDCPGTGDCFVGNATPGCDDEACCESVCALDSFCCTGTWDEICADAAAFVCGVGNAACGPGAGSCTQANGTPGCDDELCCNLICAFLPTCCSAAWDQNCADDAFFCP